MNAVALDSGDSNCSELVVAGRALAAAVPVVAVIAGLPGRMVGEGAATGDALETGRC